MDSVHGSGPGSDPHDERTRYGERGERGPRTGHTLLPLYFNGCITQDGMRNFFFFFFPEPESHASLSVKNQKLVRYFLFFPSPFCCIK